MPHSERHEHSTTNASNSSISDDMEIITNEKTAENGISNDSGEVSRKRSMKSKSGSRKIPKNQSTIDTFGKLIAPKDETQQIKSNGKTKHETVVHKKKKETSISKDTKKTNHISTSKKTAYYPEDVPWAEDDELMDGQPEADDPVVENSPTVPFLVTFLNQFRDLFDNVPDLGPQDIEEGVQHPDTLSADLEIFMCRLISLLLNRKKPVEPGRYGRALEDVAHHAKTGGMGNLPQNFIVKTGPNHLSWEDRLEFLRLLVLWALSSSTALREFLASGQVINFGPEELGMDAEGNKYYIAKGELTRFRIYRQTNPRLRYVSWRSVAGDTTELNQLIKELVNSTPGAAILETDEELEKLEKSFVADLTTEIAKSWEPNDENKPLFVTKLVSRLSRELDVLRELEAERVKEMHRERRKKEIEDLAKRARQGEGAYAGRTRGKKINYNMDDVYADEISDGEEYNNNESKEEEEFENNGSRRSARIRGIKVTVEPDLDALERHLSHRQSNGSHVKKEVIAQEETLIQEAQNEDYESDLSKIITLKYSSPPRSSPSIESPPEL